MTAPSLFCPRCATPNAAGNAVCASCSSALPRLAPAAAAPAAPAPLAVAASRPGGGDLAVLQSQLLAERARVKSPAAAAVIGFVAPWAGAFYNGKVGLGLGLLGLHAVVAIVGIPIGEVPLLLYAVFGAVMNHKWAKQTNEKALEKLIAERQP